MTETQALVHTFQDSYAADMFVELLATEGVFGTSAGSQQRTMLGITGRYVSIAVSVPRQNLEKAQELLTLFFSETSLKAPYRGAVEGAALVPASDRRRKRVAIMAAVFVPLGGGHFYARSMAAGWSLMWLSVMGFASWARAAPTWMGYWPFAVVLYDALCSGSAAERTNANETWPALKQFGAVLAGATLIALILWQGGIFIERVTTPEVFTR